MKVNYDCAPCFMRQAKDVLDEITDDEDVKVEVMSSVFKLLAEEYYKGANSNWTGSKIHRLIKDQTNSEDPYYLRKKQSNEMAKSFMGEIYNILKEDNSLETSVKIAIVGNIIDFGAYPKDTDFKHLIEINLNKDLKINQTDLLEDALRKHNKLLYLVDNAGEIVFDKILLEKIKSYDLDIILAVKEAPIVNDACMTDALEARLDEYAEIVSTGEDTVGIVYEELSDDFRKIFDEADFIISKGLGNFEGLTEIDLSDKDVFYLACAKCPVSSRLIGIDLGEMFLLKDDGSFLNK
ncbi:damage-control phosphatase ARMT1 family protein [Methanobrevibacter sp.]